MTLGYGLRYRKRNNKNMIHTQKGEIVFERRIFGTMLFLVLLLMTCNAMAADSLYTIGPGDTLEISVWRDDSLSREVADKKISRYFTFFVFF